MACNSAGTYATTAAKTMKAYDKLPPQVRRALAESPFNIAPQTIATAIRRRKTPIPVILASIHAFELLETGRGALRLYGPDHPQAKSENL